MNTRIAILGSTNGTSIRPILQKIKNGEIKNVEVACIISNRKSSGLIEFAKTLFEDDKHILYKPKFKNISSEEYDSELAKTLIEYKADYIFLIGWMRLMTNNFIKRFENRIVNIHPSLLPAFAGQMDMDIHSSILKRGCKITGATIMFIDEGADTGPIIDQSAIRIPDGIEASELKTLVQLEETKLLEKTIIQLSETFAH